MKTRIKVTHIYHSGFVAELLNKILIFDYFKNPLKFDFEKLFDSNKDIYVFVSHSHSDHYNPVILDWENNSRKIRYIFSYDVNIKNKKDNYYFMNTYETIILNDMDVKSFGTTDLGVSFLVSIGDITLYHGGDLNWWHWKEDDTEAQKKEEMGFKKEIDKIKGENIDIAFIPVDPRLEESYYLAGEYVINTLKPKLLIPMHFADNYEFTHKFKDKMENSSTTVQAISKDNNSFFF